MYSSYPTSEKLYNELICTGDSCSISQKLCMWNRQYVVQSKAEQSCDWFSFGLS